MVNNIVPPVFRNRGRNLKMGMSNALNFPRKIARTPNGTKAFLKAAKIGRRGFSGCAPGNAEVAIGRTFVSGGGRLGYGETRIAVWQAGQFIFEPTKLRSHPKCCPQFEQTNVTWVELAILGRNRLANYIID